MSNEHLVKVITLRFYPADKTPDDELSQEDCQQLFELLNWPKKGRTVSQILKAYLLTLPDLLIKQREEEIERIRAISKK